MKNKSSGKIVKIRRSVSQWEEIMQAYEESGLTQEAFCIQQSLATSTFYKWRQRLAGEKRYNQAVPEFIELTPTTQAVNSSHWDIELSLSSSIVLRIRQSN